MTHEQTDRAQQGVSVEFDQVTKDYGTVRAVDRVSLNVDPGEFVSLLGPSGSGKTTLLMMLAGFEQCSGGKILVGSRDFTRLPPNRRGIGVVFQRYALFPHMTVAENIAFPLRMRKQPRATRDREVRRALEMVRLADYEDRLPSQLSGGQQQRIALARAIVFHPQLILMDEPLGALDKKLRQHLQIEIKQLQARLGATVVFVTHDQEEALTMSDRVAVMNDGRIEQFGHPEDLYRSPASRFAAGFMGEMNFLDAVVESRTAAGMARVGVQGTTMEGRLADPGMATSEGESLTLAVRPEYFRVVKDPDQSGLPVTVTQMIFSGAHRVAFAALADGTQVKFLLQEDGTGTSLAPGAAIRLQCSASNAVLFAN